MLFLLFTLSEPSPPINYVIPPVVSTQKISHYDESRNDGFFLSQQGKHVVGRKSPYEFQYFSIVENSKEITFQLQSNLPLKGLPEKRAKAKRIGYGDLLLYYPNTTVGIKLTGKNQGIYHNVKTVNNANLHFGNKTPQEYVKRLKVAKAYDPEMKFPPEWVTNLRSDSLFSKNLNVSETKIEKDNSYLIEITVQKDLLPEGNFTAYLPSECINDYVLAMYSPTEKAELSETFDFLEAPESLQFASSGIPNAAIAQSIGAFDFGIPAFLALATGSAIWGFSSGSTNFPLNSLTASLVDNPINPPIDPTTPSQPIPEPSSFLGTFVMLVFGIFLFWKGKHR